MVDLSVHMTSLESGLFTQIFSPISQDTNTGMVRRQWLHWQKHVHLDLLELIMSLEFYYTFWNGEGAWTLTQLPLHNSKNDLPSTTCL